MQIRDKSISEIIVKTLGYIKGSLIFGYLFTGPLVGPRVCVLGKIRIKKVHKSKYGPDVLCGENVVFSSNVTIYLVGKSTNTYPRCLFIGSRTSVGEGTKIYTKDMMSIGEDCKLSSGVVIMDHDYQKESDPEMVHIGNRVRIGSGATILKGVRIGDDAVIGDGSLVSKSVPSGMMVIGNPARIIEKQKKTVTLRPEI